MSGRSNIPGGGPLLILRGDAIVRPDPYDSPSERQYRLESRLANPEIWVELPDKKFGNYLIVSQIIRSHKQDFITRKRVAFDFNGYSPRKIVQKNNWEKLFSLFKDYRKQTKT